MIKRPTSPPMADSVLRRAERTKYPWDEPLAQALGARRAHEVLADDLQETGTRHPGDIRALGEAQDEGGADHDLEVLPRVLPDVDDDDRRLVAEPEQQAEHDQHAEPEA